MKVEIINEKDISKIPSVSTGFVVTGDIHLYNFHPYNTFQNIISSRLNDITKALYLAAKKAASYKIPLIINGDLIHTGTFDYPTMFTVTKFLNTFQNLTIYIVIGNHDLNNGYSVLSPLVAYGKSLCHTVIDGSITVPLTKGILLFLVSYMNKANTLKILKRISEHKTDSRKILFIHNTFSSSRFSNNAISASGISPNLSLFKKFDLVVASDIHKHQKIMNGKGFYTSSLIPLNFGERSDEHGFHIIDLDKNVRYFVIPDAPRFKQMTLSRLQIATKSQLKSKVGGNFVKVIDDSKNKKLDKAKLKNDLTKLGALFVTFSKKQSKIKRKPILNLKKETDKKAIVSQYAKQLSQKNKLDERRVEKTGIKILLKAESENTI